MATITTLRGAAVELIANDYEVICSRGAVSFGAVKTENGFRSFFPVNGVKIFVELDEANKAIADSVFAVVERNVAARLAEVNRCEEEYQRVINAMHGDA